MSEAPSAIHLGEDDIPWVQAGDLELKVVQVKINEGLWVVRNRFQPGVVVQKHKHTGPVYAFTLSGAWKYAESEYVNRAGSYLYEPAGSVHTLTVPEDNTEVTDVWFAIYGANLNLDDDDNVESITDAAGVYAGYMAMCESQGLGRPNVLVD